MTLLENEREPRPAQQNCHDEGVFVAVQAILTISEVRRRCFHATATETRCANHPGECRLEWMPERIRTKIVLHCTWENDELTAYPGYHFDGNGGKGTRGHCKCASAYMYCRTTPENLGTITQGYLAVLRKLSDFRHRFIVPDMETTLGGERMYRVRGSGGNAWGGDIGVCRLGHVKLNRACVIPSSRSMKMRMRMREGSRM